jgi:hypothetical protein
VSLSLFSSIAVPSVQTGTVLGLRARPVKCHLSVPGLQTPENPMFFLYWKLLLTSVSVVTCGLDRFPLSPESPVCAPSSGKHSSLGITLSDRVGKQSTDTFTGGEESREPSILPGRLSAFRIPPLPQKCEGGDQGN